MAAPWDLETNVPFPNHGDADADAVRDFTYALKLATNNPGVGDISIDIYSGAPADAGLVAVGAGPPNAFGRAALGTTNFSYGLSVDHDPAVNGDVAFKGAILGYTHYFGMEVGEWVSWFFQGYPGLGAALDALLASFTPPIPGGPYAGLDTGFDLLNAAGGLLPLTDAIYPVFLPILTRTAEGAGWFKEAVTHKKLTDGVYSDGSPIKLRLFGGESGPAMRYAYPKVQTPAATTGVSFLGDIVNGTFTGGEYNEPFGDSGARFGAPAGVNSLFPAWPNGVGSVIDLGLKHYYMSSWHTPARVRNTWINRPWWNGLSADDQDRVKYAAMACCLRNIAIGHEGQDDVVKQFQTLGATVHEHLPVDVLKALGEAGIQAQDANAAADASGKYAAMLHHQRLFIRQNNCRWRSGNINRRLRFQRSQYNAEFQPNVKLGS